MTVTVILWNFYANVLFLKDDTFPSDSFYFPQDFQTVVVSESLVETLTA